MKKIIIAMLLTLATTSAFAQFEQGKQYVGASLTGLNMSYSDFKDFALGIDGKAGYFIERDIMVVGAIGINYNNANLSRFQLGAQVRYYLEENGLYMAAGTKYTHMAKKYNDVQLTPEVGYCYFLNRYITVEPAVYFDVSLTDFAHKSEFGAKVGIGIYF